MYGSRLGKCERCNDIVKPVFCFDAPTKNRVLSHGECPTCGKMVAVSEMSFKEFMQLPNCGQG